MFLLCAFCLFLPSTLFSIECNYEYDNDPRFSHCLTVDGSANDNPGCRRWHLFILLTIDPDSNESEFNDILHFLERIMETCKRDEENQATLFTMTEFATTFPMSRADDKFKTPMEVSELFTNSKYKVNCSTDLVENFQSVLNTTDFPDNETAVAWYWINNINCITIFEYPKMNNFFTNVNWNAFNLALMFIPIRIFWISETVSDCNFYLEALKKFSMHQIDYKSMKNANEASDTDIDEYSMCPARDRFTDSTTSVSVLTQSTISVHTESTSSTSLTTETTASTSLSRETTTSASLPPVSESDVSSTSTPKNGDQGESSNIGWAYIIPVASIVTLIFSFIACRCCCPRYDVLSRLLRFVWMRILKWSGYEKASNLLPQQSDNYAYPELKRKELDFWEIKMDNLVVTNSKLGSGTSALVFAGVLNGIPPVLNANPTLKILQLFSEDHNEVAVKVTHPNATLEDRRSFLQEIEFMKSFGYHPHILSLIGCSTNPLHPVLLTELCDKGDLLSSVRGIRIGKKKFLEHSDLLPIAWQISDALLYLTSRNIIHRDIAARNVLLKTSKIAMISDFGLCRHSTEQFYTTKGGKLPIKWMAPESIEFAKFSIKSDIWSFGVLLFEMYSLGQTPYSFVQPEDILKHLRSGERLQKPFNTPEIIDEIMQSCWNFDESDRPEISQIRSRLYNLVEKSHDDYGYLEFTKHCIQMTENLNQMSVTKDNKMFDHLG